MLKGIKKVHFIGIGGAGMSALARILIDKGYTVTGSDMKKSPIVEQLSDRGAQIWQGHAAGNVDGAEAIVVSTAIPDSNPEVIAAKERGLKRLHRSDVNAFLLNAAEGIAVAGAHGKTTTTSMIGVVLDHAGVSPTIIIGGEVDYLGSNAKLGKGKYLVSEADESDGSFLKLKPHIAVVTNVEDDHMDYYGTMDNIRKAFRQFIENIDHETGNAILCFDNENIRNIAAQVKRPIISYAIDHEADYKAVDIKPQGAGISFAVQYKGEKLGRIVLNIPGRHNVLNALATVAVARLAEVDFDKIAEGFTLFNGAKRRFETKGRKAGVWVVDDYAHHPTEIASTLIAARQTEHKRLICAFQPHRYTRTKLLVEEFGSCFKEADILLLTDVYSAGEAPIPGVDGRLIEKSVLEKTGRQAIYIPERGNIAEQLAKIAKPGDLIITMGAGDIFLTGPELLAKLKD